MTPQAKKLLSVLDETNVSSLKEAIHALHPCALGALVYFSSEALTIKLDEIFQISKSKGRDH